MFFGCVHVGDVVSRLFSQVSDWLRQDRGRDLGTHSDRLKKINKQHMAVNSDLLVIAGWPLQSVCEAAGL